MKRGPDELLKNAVRHPSSLHLLKVFQQFCWTNLFLISHV